MQTTDRAIQVQAELEGELAALWAHVNAATARWIDLARAFRQAGGAPDDDLARWLAFRCGISGREACEAVRVAEALEELPAIRAAFARGELTFTKVRALTRVATAASEEGLLDLAAALTASQLDRALRAFRRIAAADARETHELEYVDYYFADDGSLYLRARLPAEEGTLVLKALELARDRVVERRREERVRKEEGERAAEPARTAADPVEPGRSTRVEALVELARASLAPNGDTAPARMQNAPAREQAAPTSEQAPAASKRDARERARLVVHVDAAVLTGDRAGRCDLEGGPVISSKTALRLGCDADIAATIERDGLPLSVGRTRRTVPPTLRRLLEARDESTCCWPGCESRRHLDAHHRVHWAHGGETSLENLVLLCWHHHRLVHEGGYSIEDDPAGGLRFRNRYGVVCPSVPPRSPPGSVADLEAQHARLGLAIDAGTCRNGHGDPLDLATTVDALLQLLAA